MNASYPSYGGAVALSGSAADRTSEWSTHRCETAAGGRWVGLRRRLRRKFDEPNPKLQDFNDGEALLGAPPRELHRRVVVWWLPDIGAAPADDLDGTHRLAEGFP